jgi:hypothetical protein
MTHEGFSANDRTARSRLFDTAVSVGSGLTLEGKTDEQGIPNLLQAAVIAE